MITQGAIVFPGCHARHDGRVSNTDVIDAMNLESAIDDRHATVTDAKKLDTRRKELPLVFSFHITSSIRSSHRRSGQPIPKSRQRPLIASVAVQGNWWENQQRGMADEQQRSYEHAVRFVQIVHTAGRGMGLILSLRMAANSARDCFRHCHRPKLRRCPRSERHDCQSRHRIETKRSYGHGRPIPFCWLAPRNLCSSRRENGFPITASRRS